MGGLEIDENSAALVSDSWPAAGLYAAREVAGGVHDHNQLGGNSVLDCVAFRRVVGAACAKHMLSDKLKVSSLADLSGEGLSGKWRARSWQVGHCARTREERRFHDKKSCQTHQEG